MEADPAWESSLENATTVVSGVAKAAATAATGDVPDEDLAAAMADGVAVDETPMDADAGHPAVVGVLFVPSAAAAVLLEAMPSSLAKVASSGEAGMFIDAEPDAVALCAAAALASGAAPAEDARKCCTVPQPACVCVCEIERERERERARERERESGGPFTWPRCPVC
jgi:hypothetical protein